MLNGESKSMEAEDQPQVTVLLIGYERQENLGLRSIAAYVRFHGYNAVVVPFARDQEEPILAAVRRYQPALVGFSIIFQYSLGEFGRLMQFLRGNGVKAHFTAGGHFPSLRPRETFELLPELDTVVRFEGELTLTELLGHLNRPEQWSSIQGLAFQQGSACVLNPPRPLVSDLDSLPVILRDQPQDAGQGVRMAAMLASRGCLFNCSFCSIRQFYGGAVGALRRVRSAQAVAEEMLELYQDKGVRYFSFQDDDFAARTVPQRQWLGSFLRAMDDTGLASEVRWKISCRVDDLEPEILEAMQGRGLMAVYLGVESGSATGLRTLNKRATVAQNLSAIHLLKQHEIALAIGFMLLDPSTTLASIRENLDFLRAVGADGYIPINFCKMLPYAGTPIEAELKSAGRLRGTVEHPDYAFLDPRLDWFEILVQTIFSQRNFGPDGIVTLLQQAEFDWRLATAFKRLSPTFQNEYGSSLRQIISRSNQQAVATLERLLEAVVTTGGERLLQDQDALVELAEHQWRSEMKAEVELRALNVAMPLPPNDAESVDVPGIREASSVARA